jgi:hypothetical protein
MDLFQFLRDVSDARRLEFVVIGGQAVNALALPHRDAKDFGDLTQLIHSNRMDVRSDRFRQLVEK